MNNRTNNHDKIKKVIKKLYYYPVVALIIWLIAMISRFYELFYYDTDDISKLPDSYKYTRLVLYGIQAIVMSGRGVIYSLLYFMRYEKIRNEVIYLWNMLFSCKCFKKQNADVLKTESDNGSYTRDVI
jgi:hypothetical protein